MTDNFGNGGGSSRTAPAFYAAEMISTIVKNGGSATFGVTTQIAIEGEARAAGLLGTRGWRND